MPLTDETRARLDAAAAEIIARYPRSRSALMPLLYLLQAEEGYISADGIDFCASKLGLEAAEVAAVVTFYTMYKRRPVGEYHVGVCTNTLCAIMGGDQIFAELKEHLGVGDDETTADGKIILEHLECNAACDYAPVVMVNWEFFDNMTPGSARQLVDDVREGKDVRPTRGPRRLCTWREASRILAGYPDGQGDRRPGGRLRQPGRSQDCERARLDRAGTCAAGGDPVIPLTPVLTAHWDEPDIFTLAGYQRSGGYRALRQALTLPPAEIVQMIKDSGLRGRGGAGFPAGMKWGFIPQGDDGPRYLVVNADESEPGTCKDTPLLLASPHSLIEGAVITSYAIRAERAFVYVRGEVLHVIRRLQNAIQEAYKAGFLGPDILGSGYHLELVLHTGAGAYICGEETALLDSLEGYRGQPRLKPPFPAVAGLYARPDGDQQRRVDRQRAVDRGERCGLVRQPRHGEIHGIRDLLTLRPRHHARPVRGAARDHSP